MQRYSEISPFNLQKLNYNGKRKEYTGQPWVLVFFLHLQTCRATNVFFLELKDWICSFFNKHSLLLSSQLAAQCALCFLKGRQLARPLSAAWHKFQCYFKCQSGFDSFVANNLDLLLVTAEIAAFRHFRRERRHKRIWLISSRNIMFWTFFF